MNEPIDDRDKLEELTETLANLPVPDGPDDEVKQQVLARLIEKSDPVVTIQPKVFWERKTMQKFATIAAILLIVLGTATYFSPMQNGTPGSAFAAMLEHIDQLRTLKFTMEIEMGDRPKMVCQSLVLSPNWMHQSLKTEQLDYVQITDFRQAQILTLFQKQKLAQLIEFNDMPENLRQKNYIDEFRQMTDEDVVYLGEDTVDGIATLKYQHDKLGEHSTIWLDAKTQLPIQVVSTDVAEEESQGARVTMRDFEWNAEIDESVFTLAIPEGYTLQGQVADIAGTSVEDFVTTLQFYVRLNDDQFPDEYSTMMFLSIPKMLKKPGATKEEQGEYAKEKLAYALDRPEILEMGMQERMKLGMELQKPFGRGAMFFETTKKTHHWHFQGQGVKLGEAGKMVAWWYPKEGEVDEGTDLNTAHVLYGDLRIETMAVENLPKPDAP